MARKSQPFTLRLPAGTDALVADEARRTRRSKGAVVAALADEALRCRMFPGIAFRGRDWQRRAWIVGTALDVWEVVRAYRALHSIKRMVAETDVTERQLRLALAYAERFPQEIEAILSEDAQSIDALRARYPTVDVVEAHD